jgi:hypothetical protein
MEVLSISRPGHFTSGKQPQYRLNEGWVDPEPDFLLLGFESRTVQPVA